MQCGQWSIKTNLVDQEDLGWAYQQWVLIVVKSSWVSSIEIREIPFE